MDYVKVNLGTAPDDGNGDAFRTVAMKFNANVDQLVADLALTVPLSQKGVAGGVAPLGLDGKIASAFLPGSIDEVQEFDNLAAFPNPGVSSNLYIAKNGGIPSDPSRAYRWGGSAYIEIEPSPGSTDAVAEGAANLYFTAARVNALTSATGKDGKLTSLIDTAIATPVDGQVLTYDFASGKWKNKASSGGGGAAGLGKGYRKTRISKTSFNTLGVIGACRDSTNSTDITFDTQFLKMAISTGGFTAGSGGFGNPAALVTGTMYGVFAIKNATSGVCDVMFQTGSAEPTSMPTGFTHSRRIGSFRYTSTAGIVDFLQLGDNQFMYVSPTQFLNNSALAAGNNDMVVPVPLGVRCWVIFKFQIAGNSSAYVWVRNPSSALGTGATGASSAASSADYIGATTSQTPKIMEVLTNTAQGITVVTANGAIASGVTLIVLGYRDFLEE